jgi:hypothetical protein
MGEVMFLVDAHHVDGDRLDEVRFQRSHKVANPQYFGG